MEGGSDFRSKIFGLEDFNTEADYERTEAKSFTDEIVVLTSHYYVFVLKASVNVIFAVL